MKTVELSEVNRALSELAEPGRHEPVVVTRHGKPVAAVVPIEDTDLETLSLGTNPDFLALIAESRRRCAPGQGISTEEMRARLAEPGRLRNPAVATLGVCNGAPAGDHRPAGDGDVPRSSNACRVASEALAALLATSPRPLRARGRPASGSPVRQEPPRAG